MVALAAHSNKVNGIFSCMLGTSGLGCSKGFPKRSKFSRQSFLKSLGKKGSLFRAADRKRKWPNWPILNGNLINSLSSSFKLTSSRSWQNWIGSALILFWLRSKNWSDFWRVELHRAPLKDSRWLSCKLSSWRQTRSPIVAGSCLIWLWLRSSFRSFFKQSTRMSIRASLQYEAWRCSRE